MSILKYFIVRAQKNRPKAVSREDVCETVSYGLSLCYRVGLKPVRSHKPERLVNKLIYLSKYLRLLTGQCG